MVDMDRAAAGKIGLGIIATLACGAAMAVERDFVLGGDLRVPQTALGTPRISFGSNLFIEPCSSCNYDSNAPSAFVLGPENCFVPGTMQWIAVPFTAAATGVPTWISAPIILFDPKHCPNSQVTLSIYTDACYPTGPGTPLVS